MEGVKDARINASPVVNRHAQPTQEASPQGLYPPQPERAHRQNNNLPASQATGLRGDPGVVSSRMGWIPWELVTVGAIPMRRLLALWGAWSASPLADGRILYSATPPGARDSGIYVCDPDTREKHFALNLPTSDA